MTDDKIIMYDSDEAAQYGERTIRGWFDRHNQYFAGNEHLARYSGATHKKCDKCGEITRVNGYCKTCHIKKREEVFAKAEVIDWDGKCMVYSETLDEYYSEPILAVEDGDEHGIKPSELMLYECERLGLAELDSDQWYEELAEGDDVIDEIQGLVEKFNAGLVKLETNTWYPTSRAINVKEWEDV